MYDELTRSTSEAMAVIAGVLENRMSGPEEIKSLGTAAFAHYYAMAENLQHGLLPEETLTDPHRAAVAKLNQGASAERFRARQTFKTWRKYVQDHKTMSDDRSDGLTAKKKAPSKSSSIQSRDRAASGRRAESDTGDRDES